MSELDVSTWKKFRIGDLFEVLLAKGDIQPKQVNDGPIPLVSAGNEANGIVAFIASEGDGESEIFDKGCITVSMFGKAFYQPFDFYGVSHGRVNILKPKNKISHEVGLFLVCSIDKQCNKKYDYATMCTRTRLVEEEIMLPATPSGDPDWAYMDSFMGKILEEEEAAAEQLAALAPETGSDGHFLDVSGWKEFSIKQLGFVCHHGQRLNQSERKDGPIPFVTAGFQNHGVTQYISNDRPIYHKAITVDMFGNCFFQADDCAGDDNVYFFVNNKLTDCSKLFVSACIAGVTSKRFSYAKQFRQHDANMLKVFLPTTIFGDPDWAWMEQYMQQQLDKVEPLSEHLSKLVQ